MTAHFFPQLEDYSRFVHPAILLYVQKCYCYYDIQ